MVSPDEMQIIASIGGNAITTKGKQQTPLSRARALLDAAMMSGATGVRLDLIRADEFHRDPAIVEQMRRFEWSLDDIVELAYHAADNGLTFICTPHYPDALDLVDDFADAIHITSGDITNLPLLEKINQLGVRPLILGTGGAYLAEIETALNILIDENDGYDELTLLHTTLALSPPEGLNLDRISQLQAKFFPFGVGYCDTSVTPIATAAVGLYGVNYFEVTLDLKDGLGTDSKISYSPSGLETLVSNIRLIGDARSCGCTEFPLSDMMLRNTERRNPKDWLRPLQ